MVSPTSLALGRLPRRAAGPHLFQGRCDSIAARTMARMPCSAWQRFGRDDPGHDSALDLGGELPDWRGADAEPPVAGAAGQLANTDHLRRADDHRVRNRLSRRSYALCASPTFCSAPGWRSRRSSGDATPCRADSWGMLSAPLLSLFVLPAVYKLLGRRRFLREQEARGKSLRRRTRRSRRKGGRQCGRTVAT